jgi:hypothetical protein
MSQAISTIFIVIIYLQERLTFFVFKINAQRDESIKLKMIVINSGAAFLKFAIPNLEFQKVQTTNN